MPSHHPQSPRTKGERRRRAKATSESNKSLQERRRRSTSTPTQPQTSTTPRRASRGPTKVDNVFRWRFTCSTSKGPRHQGAVWRFNIIYKEQGTISIIELLAHKQNPLQSKQVFLDLVRISASAPARALLPFMFKTNVLAIAMVRLVDASGNNVTDFRADQPWEILLTAAADGGRRTSWWPSPTCARARAPA